MLDAQVTGVKELTATFKRLPASTQNKAMKSAMRKGANVVKAAAAANVRAVTSDEATGLLAKSIRAFAMKPLNGFLRFAVSVKKNTLTSKGVRVGLYASVLEYGKSGQRPRPWLRPAASQNTTAVLNAIETEATLRMDAAIKDATR